MNLRIYLTYASSVFPLLYLIFTGSVVAKACGKANPCSTGCCSRNGYCGIGDDFCSPQNCVDTCDYVSTNGVQCDENTHCPEGCCSKYGVCGYGPDFCAPESCLSTCDRKSECDPGDFGLKYAQKSRCPLNVCCSKYGFCGTTKAFCGDIEVARPNCPDQTTLHRVVGYYEGFGTTRPCYAMYPESIPLIYTHINYAFALIDPVTFEVVHANLKDVDLMKRVTTLKRQDPLLKVNIAIGGWAFNDPGPTANTFSHLAGSEANQKKFFKSLISFMATYDFDGVDIDWEYPVDKDRGGSPQDFENFPKFLLNLRNALKSTGGRDEVSVTLPASYWYLQHFDLKNISPHIDYFNVMSYDLHGTWDKGNKWTGNFLNAHTNLTEIELALDLIWRNDIDPSKVVMGLGFYARAFTAQDKNCLEPGCLFTSGSDPGPCSRQAGVLLNNEIDDIVHAHSLTPTLDKNAAVKIVTWGDQWLTYDDEETLKLKASHARLRCLGGVMVWAISHDTTDNKYAKALANATKRSFNGLFPVKDANGEVYDIVRDPVKQCKWTGCGEPCPQGYHLVERLDKEARKREIMIDQTGCQKNLRTWCCPNDWGLVKCGWYQHNNGACAGKCPSGHVEVGSSSKYCYDEGYQAACCEVESRSMSAYKALEWSKYPDCEYGSCPYNNKDLNQVLTRSQSGSGEAICDTSPTAANGRRGSRALCYGGKSTNNTLEDCSSVDFGGGNTSLDRSSCFAGCPADKVRVALDIFINPCFIANGGSSFCCRPSIYTEHTRTNPLIAEFGGALKDFIDKMQCPATYPPDLIAQLDLGYSSLSKRELIIPKNLELLVAILVSIFQAKSYTALQLRHVEDWDARITTSYPNLLMKKIKPYVIGRPIWKLGAAVAVFNLLCDLSGYNAQLETEDEMCKCHGSVCFVLPEVCILNRDFLPPQTLEGRGSVLEKAGSTIDRLRKRNEVREYRAFCPDGSYLTFQISAAPYTSASGWDKNHEIWNRAIDVADREDCGNPAVGEYVEDPEAVSTLYNTEHILEIQTITIFFEHVSKGLSPKLGITLPRIQCEFFEMLGKPILKDVGPAFPGGSVKSTPNDRIMDALGSTDNSGNFWLLQEGLNGLKAVFWGLRTPSNTRMQALVDAEDPYPAIIILQGSIAVFKYLNHPPVLASFNKIENNLRKVFDIVNTAYLGKTGDDVRLVYKWDLFWDFFLDAIVNEARAFVGVWLGKMITKWTDPNAPDVCAKPGAVADLIKLRTFITHISISRIGFGRYI